MKKNNKKNNIAFPAYEFGIQQGVAAGSYGANLTSGFIKDQTVGGAVSGAASGAVAGTAIMPGIGTAVGAVVGGVAGGIAGNMKKRKIEQALQSQRNAEVRANNMGNQAIMQQEWYYDNPLGNTYEFGGTNNGQIAWVNDDEIIQYPNGDTKQVKSNKKGTDNVLTSLPYGSNVFGGLDLSDSKTFAQYAGKIHNSNKKAEKDGGRYAKNSIKLNNQHLQELSKLQEMEKEKKNINGKFKGLPAYANGVRTGLDDWRLGLPNAVSTPDNPILDSSVLNTYMPGKPIASTTYSPDLSQLQLSVNNPYNIPQTSQNSTNNSVNYDNLTRLASLTPVLYNLAEYAQKPQSVSPIDNPYQNAVLNTMAKRKFSNRQLLDANRRSSAIVNYNANQITGTGQNIAYRLANEANSRGGLYDAISQMSNVNNQYLADYAGMMENLGRQSASAKTLAQDINMRNAALNKKYGATAATQISNFAQNWNRDRNLNRVQNTMLDAYRPYLRSAYTADEYNQFFNNL